MTQPIFQVYHKVHEDVFAVCRIDWKTRADFQTGLIIDRIDIVAGPDVSKTYRWKPVHNEGNIRDLILEPFKGWRHDQKNKEV